MKTRSGRSTRSSVAQQEAAELLKQALSRPGVRELMEVYKDYEKFDLASRLWRQAMSVKKIVCASNTSEPAF